MVNPRESPLFSWSLAWVMASGNESESENGMAYGKANAIFS
jgi:hypothetical protein